MTADAAIVAAPGHARTRSSSFVRDSVTGSIWTVVSRITGFGQSVAVATILGATYLGNTYQAINSLPNIIYYQLLAGSLFASILVPPLVARVDLGDRRGAQRLAKGFYGTVLLAGAGFALVLLLAAPVVLRVLTLGVADGTTAELQRQVGWTFFVIFIPQILLYVTAGTGAAVMNAHGRFALAAGAPALENIGMISTLVAAGVLFGTGHTLAQVTASEVLLLGLGTTASVAVHASAQWLGAGSCGVRLLPAAGWRDPVVRGVLKRVLPTLAYTGLAASQTIVALVIANRLAGGLVAFQLALNFFFLPIAIVTWPIARSVLPRLARAASGEHPASFWEEATGAVRLASFFVVPMAIGYVVLASPIASAISVGQLQADGGTRLVAISLGALGAGVIGETWFVLGTYAFYAIEDVRSPLRSMTIRVTVAVGVMSIALLTHRPFVLAILGFATSAGSIIGSVHLWARLRSVRGGGALIRPLARTGVAGCAMALPVLLVSWSLSRWFGATELGQVAVVAAAAATGALIYLSVQAMLRAPEIALIKLGTRLGRRDDAD